MSTITINNNKTSELLILDKGTSIVLPEFDTTAILNSNISEIVLSLFLIDNIPAEIKDVHITINPFDPITGKMDEGLSRTIESIRDSYIDIRLPRELFERTIHKPKKFLLKLVDTRVKLVFEGIDKYGTTHDPKLVVLYSDKTTEEEEIVPVINYNYYNVEAHNSNVQIGGQDNNQNFDNRKNGKGWQDNPILYLIIGVVILVLGGLIVNYFT